MSEEELKELKDMYKNFPGSFMDVDIDILFDMYLNTDDYGQNSLFFLLLNEYYLLKEKGVDKYLAHICFLMSYLLINIIVPIRTESLSLVFAKKAYNYMPTDRYVVWLESVQEDYDRTLNN